MAKTSILGKVAVQLGLVSSSFERDMNRVELRFKKFGESMSRLGDKMSQLSLPLAAAGAASLKLASDAEETQNRFNAVFGDMSGQVNEFAATLADATGRNSVQLKDGLASFQGFAQGMGLASQEAANMAKELQTLAIDFASFNNLSDTEATDRFISAMSGSSEVLDRFGVNLRDANLSAKLLEMGLASSSQEATEAQKAIARLAIIRDVMGKQGAIGDAIATSDSLANQLRRLRSQTEELAIEFGKVMVPIAQDVLGTLNNLTKGFAALSDATKTTIVQVGAIAVVAGPLLSVVGRLITALKGLGAIMLANGGIAMTLSRFYTIQATRVGVLAAATKTASASVSMLGMAMAKIALPVAAVAGLAAAFFGMAKKISSNNEALATKKKRLEETRKELNSNLKPVQDLTDKEQGLLTVYKAQIKAIEDQQKAFEQLKKQRSEGFMPTGYGDNIAEQFGDKAGASGADPIATSTPAEVEVKPKITFGPGVKQQLREELTIEPIDLDIDFDMQRYQANATEVSNMLKKGLITNLNELEAYSRDLNAQFMSANSQFERDYIGGVIEKLGQLQEEMTGKMEPMNNMLIAQAQALGQAFDQIAENFARTFVNGITDIEKFEDAWKAFGNTVVDTLKEIAAQMLKLALLKGIGSIFGLSGVTSAFDIGAGLLDKIRGGGSTAASVASAGKAPVLNANLSIAGQQLDTAMSFHSYKKNQLGF